MKKSHPFYGDETLDLKLMNIRLKYEVGRTLAFAGLFLSIVAVGIAFAPKAEANQNVVCSQFNRYGMTLDDDEVVGYTLRSSHPATVKSIQRLMDLLPDSLQYAHGEAYGEHMRTWCATYPNEGSWQASNYAYREASKEVFQ